MEASARLAHSPQPPILFARRAKSPGDPDGATTRIHPTTRRARCGGPRRIGGSRPSVCRRAAVRAAPASPASRRTVAGAARGVGPHRREARRPGAHASRRRNAARRDARRALGDGDRGAEGLRPPRGGRPAARRHRALARAGRGAIRRRGAARATGRPRARRAASRRPIRRRPTSSTSPADASRSWTRRSSRTRWCARRGSCSASWTPATRRNLADALRSTRSIQPAISNWLLFSAMVEAALCLMDEPWDRLRVDYAVRQHQQWYKGDGVYGDGPTLHMDYYNSFVIHPMLLDVLRVTSRKTRRMEGHRERGRHPGPTIRRDPGAVRLTGRDLSADRPIARLPLRGVPAARPDGAPARSARGGAAGAGARRDERGDPTERWTRRAPSTRRDGSPSGSPATSRRSARATSRRGARICAPWGSCRSGFRRRIPSGAPRPRPWTAKALWQGEDLPTDHALG